VFAGVSAHEEMGKVSIVGAGMRSHLGVAAKAFSELAGEHIDIEMIPTSSIEISCVIAGEGVEQALQALHSAFELSGSGTVGEEEPFEASRRL
jgi:aspartate kinase